eukprot:CAMPEP_0116857314 /NCGR_PEP_ID=MMETSP0418-20121206/20475_1 /TAXON_ID=1158023 /ORGANISM="Astrosyne radiata, Strain 13vi08-1A" /LENGTH=235 /DNA_ID=CAMNT_0004490965 /DNA_START=180 /DNA_END=883 /DNA_ORIENTATION=+
MLRFKYEMELLKNASKRGSTNDALFVAMTMNRNYLKARSKPQRLLAIAHILCTPDIENRSAVYYAAHCGHCQLVKLYLACIVIARVAVRRHHSLQPLCDEAKTIRSWLGIFGFTSLMGKKQFDTCVLNALNEDVRSIFQKTKFTLKELRDTLSAHEHLAECLSGNHLAHLVRKKRLPQLNTWEPDSSALDDLECAQISYDDEEWDEDYFAGEADGQEPLQSNEDEWEVSPDQYHL